MVVGKQDSHGLKSPVTLSSDIVLTVIAPHLFLHGSYIWFLSVAFQAIRDCRKKGFGDICDVSHVASGFCHVTRLDTLLLTRISPGPQSIYEPEENGFKSP